MIRILILFLISNSLFAQKNEFDLALRFAVPTENLKIWQPNSFTRYDNYDMKALNDGGLDFFYKYRVWEKYNLYFTAGLSFSRANYSFPINQDGPRDIIDDVKIANNRVILKLFGIEKKFSLYDGKIKINLGWAVTNQFYFGSKKNYYAEGLKVSTPEIYDHEHITYGYDIDLFYNELINAYGLTVRQSQWNGEYYLQLQAQLTEKMGVNFTLNYMRNTMFAYNYQYDVNYKSEDYNYNVIYIYNDDYFIARRDHFMGFKIGTYYAF